MFNCNCWKWWTCNCHCYHQLTAQTSAVLHPLYIYRRVFVDHVVTFYPMWSNLNVGIKFFEDSVIMALTFHVKINISMSQDSVFLLVVNLLTVEMKSSCCFWIFLMHCIFSYFFNCHEIIFYILNISIAVINRDTWLVRVRWRCTYDKGSVIFVNIFIWLTGSFSLLFS